LHTELKEKGLSAARQLAPKPCNVVDCRPVSRLGDQPQVAPSHPLDKGQWLVPQGIVVPSNPCPPTRSAPDSHRTSRLSHKVYRSLKPYRHLQSVWITIHII